MLDPCAFENGSSTLSVTLWPNLCIRFFQTASGVRVQELAQGSGPGAEEGDQIELEYVLRRTNGYFIYSTREGVSFQPKDVPTGPLEMQLVSASG